MKTLRTRMNLPTLVVSAAFALICGSALAADVSVKLVGAEETPPTTSSATGTGTISIAADKSVSGNVKTQGIDGTVAHIHLGAVGQAGPPIITLTKGNGGVWSVPAGAKLTDDQFASFKAGNLYVNVHSADHPAGEIRGQLKP
jgi:hypothetical protein